MKPIIFIRTVRDAIRKLKTEELIDDYRITEAGNDRLKVLVVRGSRRAITTFERCNACSEYAVANHVVNTMMSLLSPIEEVRND